LRYLDADNDGGDLTTMAKTDTEATQEQEEEEQEEETSDDNNSEEPQLSPQGDTNE